MTTSKPIKTAALSLLARQPYTTKKLKEKLMQKGYVQQEIEEIIEWCNEAGYLDDSAWATRAAERKSQKGWDRRRIYAYLRAYGVSRLDAEEALNALEISETEEYDG